MFKSDIGSESLSAHVHGRVEVGMLCMRALLCLTFANAHVLGANVLIGIVCCVSALYFYGYYTFLPYHHMRANQALVAAAALFCWATFCLLLQAVRGVPAVRLCCVRVAREACLQLLAESPPCVASCPTNTMCLPCFACCVRRMLKRLCLCWVLQVLRSPLGPSPCAASYLSIMKSN